MPTSHKMHILATLISFKEMVLEGYDSSYALFTKRCVVCSPPTAHSRPTDHAMDAVKEGGTENLPILGDHALHSAKAMKINFLK
jgi:hypothetical protein